MVESQLTFDGVWLPFPGLPAFTGFPTPSSSRSPDGTFTSVATCAAVAVGGVPLAFAAPPAFGPGVIAG